MNHRKQHGWVAVGRFHCASLNTFIPSPLMLNIQLTNSIMDNLLLTSDNKCTVNCIISTYFDIYVALGFRADIRKLLVRPPLNLWGGLFCISSPMGWIDILINFISVCFVLLDKIFFVFSPGEEPHLEHKFVFHTFTQTVTVTTRDMWLDSELWETWQRLMFSVCCDVTRWQSSPSYPVTGHIIGLLIICHLRYFMCCSGSSVIFQWKRLQFSGMFAAFYCTFHPRRAPLIWPVIFTLPRP